MLILNVYLLFFTLKSHSIVFFCNRFRMDSGSGGGPPMLGRDLTWKYYSQVEGNRNEIICSFCGLLMKSEGITRFKF